MLQLSKNILLASKSPRRQQLLHDMGLQFKIVTKDTNENFSALLVKQQIPVYLAEKKALAFETEIGENDLILTADTIVWVNNLVLNKPENEAEAFAMLRLLSGNMHQVFTGVCLKTKTEQLSFFDETKVWFKNITDDEIWHYIKNYKPFDKAGSYGAQDWIGLVGIEKIEGSYFNVMGLPVHKLYDYLKRFSA